MNVLDSSAWIEVLRDGENHAIFYPIAMDYDNLLVPTIVMYEVLKHASIWGSTDDFEEALAFLKLATIVPLSEGITLRAIAVAQKYKLALADSIILSTAQLYDAGLWTQDKHFKDIDGVKYFPKS